MYAVVSETDNYKKGVSAPKKFIVNPKAVTVTAQSHTFAYTADFHISDHFDFLVKGGCEAGGLPDFDMPYERGYIGGALQYYPLADSQDLRLHALACYDTIEGPLFSGGITYNLNLTNLFTR